MSRRLSRLRHALHVRLVRAVEQGVERVVSDRIVPRLDVLAAEVRAQRVEVTDLQTAAAALREDVAAMRRDVVAREIRDRRDMIAAGERDAVTSSARFVSEAMPGARTFPDPAATLDHALEITPDSGGLALEFGVYSGTTLRAIAAARGDGRVYGFDSFQGLPEDWRAGFAAGTFGEAEPPDVPGAELVVGWFADTLPSFLDQHPDPIDLLHLDADLYSSTATVLELAGPRLRPGSVVVFDEYLNHPGWEDGEHKAWTEYVARTGTGFTYEAFTHDNEQVVVVVTSTSHALDATPRQRSAAEAAR